MRLSSAATLLTPASKGYALVTFEERRLSAPHPALRFVHNHFGLRLTHFELGVRFLDLCGVVFQLSRQLFYFLLLLRDRCPQVLNFEVEHGLLGGVRNGCGLNAFERSSTRAL